MTTAFRFQPGKKRRKISSQVEAFSFRLLDEKRSLQKAYNFFLFRFGKSVSSGIKKNTNSDESGFLFGNSTRKKEAGEQRLRSFFGKENKGANGSKGSINL